MCVHVSVCACVCVHVCMHACVCVHASCVCVCDISDISSNVTCTLVSFTGEQKFNMYMYELHLM